MREVQDRESEREKCVLRSAVAFYCLIRRRYFRCYFFSFAFWTSKFGPSIVYFGCHACSFCAVGIHNEAIYTNLILSSVCAIVLYLFFSTAVFYCHCRRFRCIIIIVIAALTVQPKTMFNTRLQQIINPCMIKWKVNVYSKVHLCTTLWNFANLRGAPFPFFTLSLSAAYHFSSRFGDIN